jgi:hypothetical protein
VRWTKPAGDIGPNPCADVSGTEVTLTDDNFHPFAHGQITGQALERGWWGGCFAPFRVDHVPDADAYLVQVNGEPLHSESFSHQFLVDEGWTMPLVYIPAVPGR